MMRYLLIMFLVCAQLIKSTEERSLESVNLPSNEDQPRAETSDHPENAFAAVYSVLHCYNVLVKECRNICHGHRCKLVCIDKTKLICQGI